jgi:hypothetical protein
LTVLINFAERQGEKLEGASGSPGGEWPVKGFKAWSEGGCVNYKAFSF